MLIGHNVIYDDEKTTTRNKTSDIKKIKATNAKWNKDVKKKKVNENNMESIKNNPPK